MSRESTRERILEAAEELFAERGISGSSLRAVTQRAGANLAAVHYHFGSKEGLVDAVVERRSTPINRLRLQELDRLEAEAAPESPAAEQIVAAFVQPVLAGMRPDESQEKKRAIARLLPRLEAQPPDQVEALYRRHFGQVSARFIAALGRALPELPPAQVLERFRFAVGVLAQLVSGSLDLDTIPGHPPHPSSDESRLQHAALFIAAGFRAASCAAPSSAPAASERSESAASRRPLKVAQA